MTHTGRRQVLGLGLVAAVAFVAPGVKAQDDTALEGRVIGPDGAPVASATVVVSSPMLPQGDETFQTDRSGAFRMSPIQAGLYDVRVERVGFRPAEWRDARVDEGKPTRIEITLEPRSGGGY